MNDEGPYDEADWYLSAWMAYFNWSGVDFAEKAGWSPSTLSELATGKTKYNRTRVNQAARALGIAPFELMMPPEAALDLRKVREALISVAGEKPGNYRAPRPLPEPRPARSKRGRPRKSTSE